MVTIERITEESPIVSIIIEIIGSPIILRKNIFSIKKPIKNVKISVITNEAIKGI